MVLLNNGRDTMTKTTETLAEFTERMSKVPKETEFHIGRAVYGNSRAIFYFEKQVCYLESRGYSTYKRPNSLSQIPDTVRAFLIVSTPPSDSWWTDYMSYGKRRAKKIAKYYSGDVQEAPYAEEDGKWFNYFFKDFEHLMQFVYDRYTGKFEELWGKEPTKYVQCFGDQTPVEMNTMRDFE